MKGHLGHAPLTAHHPQRLSARTLHIHARAPVLGFQEFLADCLHALVQKLARLVQLRRLVLDASQMLRLQFLLVLSQQPAREKTMITRARKALSIAPATILLFVWIALAPQLVEQVSTLYLVALGVLSALVASWSISIFAIELARKE